MILVLRPERIEEDLAAGDVVCPRCDAPLRAWAWARSRHIRQVDGLVRGGPASPGTVSLVPGDPRAGAGTLLAPARGQRRGRWHDAARAGRRARVSQDRG